MLPFFTEILFYSLKHLVQIKKLQKAQSILTPNSSQWKLGQNSLLPLLKAHGFPLCTTRKAFNNKNNKTHPLQYWTHSNGSIWHSRRSVRTPKWRFLGQVGVAHWTINKTRGEVPNQATYLQLLTMFYLGFWAQKLCASHRGTCCFKKWCPGVLTKCPYVTGWEWECFENPYEYITFFSLPFVWSTY